LFMFVQSGVQEPLRRLVRLYDGGFSDSCWYSAVAFKTTVVIDRVPHIVLLYDVVSPAPSITYCT
ncbi:MAG: hypothetical protein AAF438_16440, partial [Pseudomonadota bacterium]